MSFSPSSASVSSLGERGGGVICVSGVAMSIDLQPNLAVFLANLVGLHRLIGRQRLRAAAPQVEKRTMTGAFHCTGVPVELPLGEGPVVVRAAVLDREELAARAAEHADLLALDLDQAHLALAELVGAAHGDVRCARHVIPTSEVGF